MRQKNAATISFKPIPDAKMTNYTFFIGKVIAFQQRKTQ